MALGIEVAADFVADAAAAVADLHVDTIVVDAIAAPGASVVSPIWLYILAATMVQGWAWQETPCVWSYRHPMWRN